MNETQLFTESYLAHHGVKGMKWGVRRYIDKNGKLTPAGVKRYARKGYAQDSYNSNKTLGGKVYDKVTGAHKIGGDMMYNMSSDKKNKARAEKYLAERNNKAAKKSGNSITKKVSEKLTSENAAKFAKKGAKKTAKLAAKMANTYVVDQLVFDGAGTRAAKSAVKYTGRAVISAWILANGGSDIRWYDN